MVKIKKKKCRNCRRLFIPDYRNHNRQKYCKRDKCRKASKTASQKKWLNKPENKNHFRGPENVQRVQDWRKQNPGYWKILTKNKIALQDSLTVQDPEYNDDNVNFGAFALQDLLTAQSPVIIGLISNFIGSALQDDIAETLLRMQQSGQDILYPQFKTKGGKNGCKTNDFAQTDTQNPQKLQLGRSPAG